MPSARDFLATFAFIGSATVLSGIVPHYDLPDMSQFASGSSLPEPVLKQLRNPTAASALLFASVLAFVAFVVLHLRRRARFPPLVPYYNPLYGSTPEYSARPKEFLDKAFEKYGPVFRANILGRDQVILDHTHANLLFNLLGKGFDHEKGVISLQYFDVVIKLGIEHHLHDSGRMILKFLNPTSPSYDNFGPMVCLIYKRVLEQVIKGTEKSVNIADPFELCKKCLAEAMASIMVGEALATDKDIAWVFLNVSECVAEVGGLGGHGSILSLLLPFYARLRAHYVMKVKDVMGPYKKVLRAKVKEEINRRIKLRQSLSDDEWAEVRSNDVLQGLLDEQDFANGSLPVDEFMSKIENILLFIIFASIHGTAVALSWVLYKVASDASYQQTIYNEIAEHITDGDDATALTPTKLKTMTHLDSFTREVLRWRPDCLSPTPRMATKDVELDNGYIIPKGMLVTHVFYRTHTNPEKQKSKDPNEFSPWRYVDKPAASSVHVSNSFLPFGVGKTACPGRFIATYEIKLFIALVVSHWEVSLPDGMNVDHPGFTFEAPPSGRMVFKERAKKDILV